MEVADRQLAGGLGVAIGHAHHHDLVEAEDVAQPILHHHGIHQRQFGGAGIAEDELDAFGDEEIEEDVLAGTSHAAGIAAPARRRQIRG